MNHKNTLNFIALVIFLKICYTLYSIMKTYQNLVSSNRRHYTNVRVVNLRVSFIKDVYQIIYKHRITPHSKCVVIFKKRFYFMLNKK